MKYRMQTRRSIIIATILLFTFQLKASLAWTGGPPSNNRSNSRRGQSWNSCTPNQYTGIHNSKHRYHDRVRRLWTPNYRSRPTSLNVSPNQQQNERSSSGTYSRNTDQPTITWINGRRCLFIPSRNKIHLNKLVASSSRMEEEEELNSEKLYRVSLPPIVILGGMAQSISSWEHHLPTLSKDRDIFIYEYLGSGLGYRHPESNAISNCSEHDYYHNVSLEKQCQELKSVLQQAFPKCQQFDIVAFSLGARIALTTIASFPTLIRKAHLTGVGLERNSFAKIVIQSWKEILFKSAGMYGWNDDGGGDGDHIIHERNLVESTALTSFAWSIIMTTYSKEFLTKNGSEKISSWVDHICQNNNVVGLTKLLEQTHDNNEDDRMISIVQQIKRKKSSTQGKIHIGEIDEISTVAQAEGLNELLGWETTNGVTIYENCGHAVMNENGRQWRKNMLDYLNA